jgi:hypothetical protein
MVEWNGNGIHGVGLTFLFCILQTELSTTSINGGQLQHRQQQQQQWDIDMAAEIGQSLMIEIKRMQGLLQEKNDSLSMLSLEKVEAYQKLDQLTSQLKQRSNDLGRVSFPCPFLLFNLLLPAFSPSLSYLLILDSYVHRN